MSFFLSALMALSMGAMQADSPAAAAEEPTVQVETADPVAPAGGEENADDPGAAAAEEPTYTHPVIIRLEGTVTPFMSAFLSRKLEAAREEGADLVIFEIDSPGGLVSSMEEMIRMIEDIDWAATMAWVEEEALSAAALTALSCDYLVLAPDARLGDAGPIAQGDDRLFRHAEEKVISALVLRMRNIADKHDRPPALVEAMIDKDSVVLQVTNVETGEEGFLTEKEFESLPDPDQWRKGRPIYESREGYFLNVNGKRAHELGLAEATATSLTEHLQTMGIDEQPQVISATWVDTAATLLNSWEVTVLLLIVAGIALLVELSAPGMGVGGLISLLCFGLFFWSRFLGGTAGWLEVVLLICGILFLAAEIFVIPGFGIAGLGGVVLIALSLFMASRHMILPESARDLQQLNQTALTLLGSGVGFVIVLIVFSRYLGDIPVLRSFTLTPPNLSDNGAAVTAASPAVAAPWEVVAVGDQGKTLGPLRPSGKAEFADRAVDVVTEGEFVDGNLTVEVVRKQGTRVVVRPV